MKRILIIYSSVHGQTQKIATKLAQQLTALDNDVVTADIKAAPALNEFDKIIIGASIRHGKHNPSLYEFIEKHQAMLMDKVSGFSPSV